MTAGRRTPGSAAGPTLRASEIGTYLFCRRAWWYDRRGLAPDRTPALETGLDWHARHGRRALRAGMLRTAGRLLILAGLTTAAVWIAQTLLT